MSEEKSLLTLHYFPLKARGHASVVANAYWGKEMKWEKYSFDDWKNNKNDIHSHCAFDQLPVLNDGDEWIPQSNCILRYLGRKWGKAGGNDKDALLSDVLIEESADIFDILVAAKYTGNNTLKAWDEAFKKFPKQWTYLEKLMNGQKFGSELLIGDMALFAAINIVFDNDPHTLKNHENLKKWYDAIANNDSVKSACSDCVIWFKLPERPNFSGKYVCRSTEGMEKMPNFSKHENAKMTLQIIQEGNEFKMSSCSFFTDNKEDTVSFTVGTKFSHLIQKSEVEQIASWDGGNLVTSTVDSKPKLPTTWSTSFSLSDDGKTLTAVTPYTFKGQMKTIFKRENSEENKNGLSGTWVGTSAEGHQQLGEKFKIKEEKLVFSVNGDDIKGSCQTYGNGYEEEECSYKVGTRCQYHNKVTKTDHEATPRFDGEKLVMECKDLGTDMKYTLIYEVSEDGSTLSWLNLYSFGGTHKIVYDRQA